MKFKQTRVNGGSSHDPLTVASSEAKVVEIQTIADTAALWLSAPALPSRRYAPQQKLKDARSSRQLLKADEEDRKTDHAPLVAVTATIETNLWEGDLETGMDGMRGDLTQMETESNEALSEWEEERQKSRADELRSRSLLRRSSPQSMNVFLWPCDSTGGRAHSSTAMLFFFREERVV